MKRVGSQLLYCSPGDIRRMHAIEISDENIVTKIFALQDMPVESAHTLFYDGLISAAPVSLKLANIQPDKLSENWLYVDLSQTDCSIPAELDKTLLLDFASNNIDDINNIIKQRYSILKMLSIYDIINACVYNAAIITGQNKKLTIQHHANPILWQDIDLVNKTITSKTNIRTIFATGNK